MVAGSSGHEIGRAIDFIYEAATTPSLWPEALQEVARCTDDVGAVLLWARDDGSFGTITSPALADAQKEYQERWWRQDIRAQRAVERSYWLQSDVVTDEDCITPDEIATHPIYTQFLAKFGLRWVASVGVSPDPMLHAAVSVQRSSAKAPFSANEKQVIAQLGKHIERALRIGTRLMEANATADTLGEALRRMGVAVFTLDHADRVLFKNDAAEQVLDGPLRIEDGRLSVRSQGRYLRFDRAVASQVKGKETPSGFPPLLLHAENGRRLIAFQMPMRVTGDLAEAVLRQSRKLVLVIDRSSETSTDLHALRELFGLTAAEARLAAVIGMGASPREAAQQLQITEATARTVLKRVLSKTGTNRQSQVAALLGSVGLRG